MGTELSREEILEGVFADVADAAGIDKDNLGAYTRLSAIGIELRSALEILMKLNKRFGINLKPEGVYGSEGVDYSVTVNHLVNCVRAAVQSAAEPESD